MLTPVFFVNYQNRFSTLCRLAVKSQGLLALCRSCISRWWHTLFFFFYSLLQSHKVHVKIILDQTDYSVPTSEVPGTSTEQCVWADADCLNHKCKAVRCTARATKKKKVSRLIQLKSVLRAMQARRKPNAYNIVIIVSFLKKRKLLSISLSPACLSLENKKPALKEEGKK